MNRYQLIPQYDNRKSFYGKATVVVEGGTKTLTSYTTEVARIADGIFKLIADEYAYSLTTMRHVREFMKQEGVEVLEKKKLLEKYLY